MFRTARCGAFTLIELLLVVAIIGVVALGAAPRYANAVARYRVDVAAKRVVADITLVQARARATSATQYISFAATGSTYQLPYEKDQQLSTAVYTVALTDRPYFATISNINFGGDGLIYFNGYGLPDSGGSLTLRSGALTRTLTLDATTGTVTIQ